MTTDKDLRRLAVDGHTPQTIAKMFGFSEDSVRGRISRTSLHDRVELAHELADRQPLVNAGLERQKALIRRHDGVFQYQQDQVKARGSMATAVFVSDLHLPYTNWAALNLTLEIIKEIQPDYISAMNDLFDFEGYGRWADTRSPAAMLWSDDILNGLKVASEIHAAYKRAAPEAMLLAVQGNHDNWMYNHIRTESRNGFTEHNIADFMETLEAQGVVQFVNGSNKHENIIQLSPGLKWVHGVSAAAFPSTVAKATLELCSDEGIFYNVTSGHTHRSAETLLLGVRHWNSGALCTQDPSYMKHKPHWTTAVVINRFDPNSRYTEGNIVEYKERGGNLVARYDGVDFDVRLE